MYVDEADKHDTNVFEGIKPSGKETSIQEILISLISDKENLSLKTEINNPKGLTALYMLKEYFKSSGYTKTSELLDTLIEKYMEYMVSNNRKSRKEIIKALSSWIDKEYSKNNQLLIRQQDNL